MPLSAAGISSRLRGGGERQFLNRHLAEDESWVVDDAHGVFRRKIVLKSRKFRLEA